MIALEGVSTRRAPFALARLSLKWGEGVSAILGSPADGGPALLALMAGVTQPRTGRIRVLDGTPTDPRIRAQIAYVPFEPWLPDALRVDEALALAASLRAGHPTDPTERLALLGVQSLAGRPVRSLSRGEARAVALVEGLTSPGVRALFIEEPLVGVDPRATARLPEALRAKGRSACIVIATGSLRDAGSIADDFLLLHRGAVRGPAPSLDALTGPLPEGSRLLVVARNPAEAHALIAALAREPDVDRVEQDRADDSSVHDRNVVRIRGRSAVLLARAAARSVVAAGIDVLELRLEPPSLDEAYAAAARASEATYAPPAARAAPEGGP